MYTYPENFIPVHRQLFVLLCAQTNE